MGQGQFQRRTRQRQAILEELRKLSSHPTAEGLHEIVRRRLPRISLGTVYRNLDRLAAAGVIQKLDVGGSRARFDGNVDRHCHIRCAACGRVDDLPGAPLDLPKARQDDCHGYQLLDYRLEFVGICPACRTRSDVSRRSHREDGSC